METIKVIVRGGVVQDVENIPEGMQVNVLDYDNGDPESCIYTSSKEES